jgi:hypothetical protein
MDDGMQLLHVLLGITGWHLYDFGDRVTNMPVPDTGISGFLNRKIFGIENDDRTSWSFLVIPAHGISIKALLDQLEYAMENSRGDLEEAMLNPIEYEAY